MMRAATRLSHMLLGLAVVLACAALSAAGAGAITSHAPVIKPPSKPQRLVPTGLYCEDLITGAEAGKGLSLIGAPAPECDFGPTPGPLGVLTNAQLELPIQLVRFVFEVSPPKHWHFHYLIAKCGHERFESPRHGGCHTYNDLGNRAWLEIDPDGGDYKCAPLEPTETEPTPPKPYNCGIDASAALQVDNAVAKIIVYGEPSPGDAKAYELLALVAHEL